MKRRISMLLVLMLSFTLVFGSIETVNAASKPTKMTLSVTAKTVDIGGTVKISVKSVTPSKASKAVTFTSSNKRIATVSTKGVVKGKKKGKVTITVKSKKNKYLKKKVTITVKNLKPTRVKLSSASIKLDKTKTLKPVFSPVGLYVKKAGTWKSSNPAIATVSSKGVVKGKKLGKAKITYTAYERNSKGKKVSGYAYVTVGTIAKTFSINCPVGKDKEIKEYLYSNSVSVVGDSDVQGRLIFNNCAFKKDICNKTKSGIIIFDGDRNEFGGKCIIDNELKLTFEDVLNDIKAGGDSPYPKFIFASKADVSEDGSGLVTAWANKSVTFNGEKYTKADITETYEIESGDVSDKDPDMIYVAQYWENGSSKVGVFGFVM